MVTENETVVYLELERKLCTYDEEVSRELVERANFSGGFHSNARTTDINTVKLHNCASNRAHARIKYPSSFCPLLPPAVRRAGKINVYIHDHLVNLSLIRHI